ncbi:hypothetical protein FBUS_06673 [Fasciolopsis buskii]|uniref:Uncharacterized protein n=1 Tax=Fasciolopsis buskii TaxID=27845 RepID=A0A8E0S6W5_9TREM|nr:hypothetical protein FBUS_06673 [Fasciolopsis buski]
MVSIKLLTAFILSNPKCSDESLEIVRHMLQVNYLLPTLLELTGYWLASVHDVDDLLLFKKLFTEDVCKYLLQTLHITTNVHTKKLITTILGHCVLLHTFQYPVSHDCDLAEEDIEFFLTTLKLYRKFTIPSDLHVRVSSSLIRRTFQQKLSDHGPKVLFLICADVFCVEDSSASEFRNFLMNLSNWNSLCARTICVHLRHKIPLSSPLWHMIVTSWSDAVGSSLLSGQCEELNRLVNPVCSLARCHSTVSMANGTENLLHNLFMAATEKKSTQESVTKCNLWNLISILVTPAHIDMLKIISERLGDLVSELSQGVKELEAALSASERLCSLLEDDKKITDFVGRLNQLSECSSDPHVSFLLLRSSVHICSDVSHKPKGNDALERTQSCVVGCFALIVERLCRIPKELQSTAEHIDGDFPTDFHMEQYLVFAETLLEVAMECELFRLLADSSTISRCGFSLSNEQRVHFVCSITHCIGSILTNLPAHISDENNFYIEQAWTTFNDLINFDSTEIFGYSSALNNLLEAKKSLNQIQLSDLSKYHENIIQGVNKKLDAVIRSLDDLMQSIKPTPSCPECYEAPAQLIQDIITIRPGDMVQDCVEG